MGTTSPNIADRLVHTYSVVACDPYTGQLGVAVQSHFFSVGSIVPWAEAGVGAVATQSFAFKMSMSRLAKTCCRWAHRRDRPIA